MIKRDKQGRLVKGTSQIGGAGFQKGHKTYSGTEKTTFKKGQTSGEKNPNWKGDNVGYFALHRWIENRLGKPNHCEMCGTTEKRMYHWANKYHTYQRNTEDWIRLCASCHSKYDKQYNPK